MTQDHINIGPLRPATGPLARLGGAAAQQPLGGGSMLDQVSGLQQCVRSLQDQVYALSQFFDQLIQVPMLIASGDNHQPGVVPDPGATAGALKFLREDATWSLLTVPALPQLSRSLAYKSAVQSIPDSTNTALTFNTNVADVGGIHSTSVNPTRFTAVVTGWHLAQGQAGFAVSAAGTYRQLAISVNGNFVTPVPIARIATTPTPIIQAAATLQLTAGDYVEFQVFQDSGGALNTYDVGTFGSLTFISR